MAKVDPTSGNSVVGRMRDQCSMNYDDDEILEQLPPREAPPSVPMPVDYTTTEVQRYVRDVVEQQEPIPESEMLMMDIVKALYRRGVVPPVSCIALAEVMNEDLGNAEFKYLMGKYPGFLPRALKALNGPHFRVVPLPILAAAADRERTMSGMPHGWGVSSPPAYATAYRLLTSCGLPGDLLPPYKTLPPSSRERIMNAWQGTCKRFGWEACEPPGDERASRRHAPK